MANSSQKLSLWYPRQILRVFRVFSFRVQGFGLGLGVSGFGFKLFVLGDSPVLPHQASHLSKVLWEYSELNPKPQLVGWLQG